MFVLIALIHVGLFRTRWGLRVRSVGEHPKAADTVGIKVLAVRYRNASWAAWSPGSRARISRSDLWDVSTRT
jgi:ABC-type uncharacterized transport system permease subunit